jgi:histidinol-phosphate aminotransferase
MQYLSDLKKRKMAGLDNLVRENVRSLVPYSCARDEYHGKNGIFLDANENPFGALNRYPDPYQKELKSAISKLKGVEEEMIFLGNGSDEIIDLCFRIYCNPGTDKALTFYPTYGMYQVSAAINNVSLIRIPLDENFQIDTEKTSQYFNDDLLKLLIVCSPNNPTGNKMKRGDLEKIFSRFGGIVLLDEAYIDFSDEPSFIRNLDTFPNLIVMQTFSKAWGMASVRVGMAFASPAIIHYFNKMKPPYNISTLNQEAVLEKISDISRFQEEIKLIKEERERVSSELRDLSFIRKVFRSDANFIMARMEDATFIYNYLVNNDIVVRNRSSVVENCLRITIGTRDENNRLLSALKNIVIVHSEGKIIIK